MSIPTPDEPLKRVRKRGQRISRAFLADAMVDGVRTLVWFEGGEIRFRRCYGRKIERVTLREVFDLAVGQRTLKLEEVGAEGVRREAKK